MYFSTVVWGAMLDLDVSKLITVSLELFDELFGLDVGDRYTLLSRLVTPSTGSWSSSGSPG